MIDWNDPVARARLIDRIGPAAYEKAQQENVAATALCVVNGYPLRPIQTRFGRLIQVYGDTRAFTTLEAAKAHAVTLAPRS